VAPVEPPEGNGKLLKYRVDALEHRVKGDEQAYKFIAEKGAKANEQIRVHDEQFSEIERRLTAVETLISDVPVLRERLDTAIDQMRSIRTALYSAAGGLALVAAAVVFSP
jgi:DNA repair exonuclease SbcCD ATPase subunit